MLNSSEKEKALFTFDHPDLPFGFYYPTLTQHHYITLYNNHILLEMEYTHCIYTFTMQPILYLPSIKTSFLTTIAIADVLGKAKELPIIVKSMMFMGKVGETFVIDIPYAFVRLFYTDKDGWMLAEYFIWNRIV